MQSKYPWLLVGALLGSAAHAQNWFAVPRPGEAARAVVVEVDLDSVRARGTVGEGVIRVSYGTSQTHRAGFEFRSFVATAQFDCQRRSTTLASAAYFAQAAGQGMRVGADSSGREEGMPPGLLETVPPPTRQSLLRATCGTTQTNN